MVGYPGWENDFNNRANGGSVEEVGGGYDPYQERVLAALEALVRDTQEKVQRGVTEHISISSVTTTGFNNPIKFSAPAFSLIIINDGPQALDYRIPYGNNSTGRLNAGEQVSFAYEKARVDQIGLQSVASTTAIRVAYTY